MVTRDQRNGSSSPSTDPVLPRKAAAAADSGTVTESNINLTSFL
jgi:hypothetical protein